MKTALEWLFEQYNKHDNEEIPISFYIFIEHALQMEKEQILLAWENGSLPAMLKEYKCSRDYFKETYKKNVDETY
jgi:hypothetical protein